MNINIGLNHILYPYDGVAMVTSCSASSARRRNSFSSSAARSSSRRTRATLSLLRTCQLFFGKIFMFSFARKVNAENKQNTRTRSRIYGL